MLESRLVQSGDPARVTAQLLYLHRAESKNSTFDSEQVCGFLNNSTRAIIRTAMNIPSYIAEHFVDYIDSYTPEEQYRQLYNLPDGRFIAPEVKHRMFYKGERASEALKHVRWLLPMPFSPNSLPRTLFDAPPLIDEARWNKARHRARAELRSRGVLDSVRRSTKQD